MVAAAGRARLRAYPPQYEYFALLTTGSSAGGFPTGRDEDEDKPELGEKVHRSLL